MDERVYFIPLGNGLEAGAYFQDMWDEWEADFDESNVCSVPEILIDLNLSE
jgi:hypothetical protein